MKEIIKKEYEGECPVCHRKQRGDNPSYVDIECYKCREKRENEEKNILMKEFKTKIIGSEIIFFDLNDCYMKIKCKDGTFFQIEVESKCGWEGSVESSFEINRLERG